jgi:hypothetical protein
MTHEGWLTCQLRRLADYFMPDDLVRFIKGRQDFL